MSEQPAVQMIDTAPPSQERIPVELKKDFKNPWEQTHDMVNENLISHYKNLTESRLDSETQSSICKVYNDDIVGIKNKFLLKWFDLHKNDMIAKGQAVDDLSDERKIQVAIANNALKDEKEAKYYDNGLEDIKKLNNLSKILTDFKSPSVSDGSKYIALSQFNEKAKLSKQKIKSLETIISRTKNESKKEELTQKLETLKEEFDSQRKITRELTEKLTGKNLDEEGKKNHASYKETFPKKYNADLKARTDDIINKEQITKLYRGDWDNLSQEEKDSYGNGDEEALIKIFADQQLKSDRARFRSLIDKKITASDAELTKRILALKDSGLDINEIQRKKQFIFWGKNIFNINDTKYSQSELLNNTNELGSTFYKKIEEEAKTRIEAEEINKYIESKVKSTSGNTEQYIGEVYKQIEEKLMDDFIHGDLFQDKASTEKLKQFEGKGVNIKNFFEEILSRGGGLSELTEALDLEDKAALEDFFKKHNLPFDSGVFDDPKMQKLYKENVGKQKGFVSWFMSAFGWEKPQPRQQSRR